VIKQSFCLAILAFFAAGILASAQNAPSSSSQRSTLSAMGQKDILTTLATSGKFGTFGRAVAVAGLTDTLKGKGPFTILAPTDEAFSKLPADKLQKLMSHPSHLKEVLLGHVVSGKMSADDLKKAASAKTAQGSSLNFKKEGNDLMVGNAKVIQSDLQASNGTIQVIDSVLLPE